MWPLQTGIFTFLTPNLSHVVKVHCWSDGFNSTMKVQKKFCCHILLYYCATLLKVM